MKHLNFFSKSSSRSMGHRVTTLALTVGSPSAHRRGTMLRLLSVLVLILTIGVGNVWGTTATITTGTYTKQNSVSVTENGSYIFMFGTTTSAYIMTNENASSSNYVAKSSQYTSLPSSITITNSNKNLVWVASDYNNGNFKLCGPYGYCYCQGTGKLAANQNSSSTWHIGTTSNVIYLIDGNSCYVKDAGANGFRAYSTTQNRTQLVAVYKLATSYTISAQSNNTNYGTVSGTTTITASPETGYRVSTTTPYTVSPANSATVTQDGNTFSVTASANTTITINFEAIPTHTVTWKCNGSSWTSGVVTGNTTVASGSKISAMPTAPTTSNCDNTKVFVGWTATKDYTNATTAPTDLFTDVATSPTIGADVTFYAVFADEEEGEAVEEWQQCTTLDDFVDGDFYLFVSPKYNNTYYYVPAPSSSVNQELYSSTADGNQVASNTNPTSITKAQGAWKLIKSSTSWKIQSSNASTIYLYAGTNNNKLGASTSGIATSTWTITKDNSTTTFAFKYNDSRYLCAYNASPYGFRTYTGTGTNGTAYLTVYHLVSSSGTTFSNYRTSCCQSLGSINGSLFWTTHFCPAWPAKH